MTICTCNPESPDAGSALALDRFDFASSLRRILAGASQSSVGGTAPLVGLSPPAASLTRTLLESWPYVAELLSIYDAAIAAESYLPTARLHPEHLVELLGYQPRPATAPRGEVAAYTRGRATVSSQPTILGALSPELPAPAVVESEARSLTSAALNELVIAPIRDPEFQGQLLLESATAAAIRGTPILFMWGDEVVHLHASEILTVFSTQGPDGADYVGVVVSRPPDDLNGVEWENVALLSPSQSAYPLTDLFEKGQEAVKVEGGMIDTDNFKGVINLLRGGYKGASEAGPPPTSEKSMSLLHLDSTYRSIVGGDVVIVQSGAHFRACRVLETKELAEPLNDNESVKIPVTQLKITPALPAGFVTSSTTNRLVIHYNFHDIGRLTRPAKHILAPADLVNTPDPILLEGLYDPPPPGLEPKELILEDANGVGVLVKGTIAFEDDGSAAMRITEGDWDPETMLRVPVRVHGNVLHVSVGETVRDEVLGDGDASIPFQSFDLKRSPLTYLPAPGTPRGIATTLEVRVHGVLWREVPTFFTATPTDQVYIVRHDEDQGTTITFGDGIRGARLPTGRSNIGATYRFGAGAAPIPAGSISQILRGVPGLVRVRNPAPLTGGSDREGAQQLRKNGPASALILGRLVGLADFGARAQSFSGVLQSKVERTWDQHVQSAVAKVWFIPTSPGGDAGLAMALRRDLEALSEEGTIVEAAPAQRIPERLRVVIVVDPAYRDEDVTAAVYSVLTDPEEGLLALANARIGGTLMRAELAAAVRSVAGVLDIGAIDRAGGPFPAPGLRAPAGAYYDFLGPKGSGTTIEAIPPEQRPCTEVGT